MLSPAILNTSLRIPTLSGRNAGYTPVIQTIPKVLQLQPRLRTKVLTPTFYIDNSSSSLVDDKVEVVTNTAAFIPFSYGPANCAGRNLALVEMRIVVALLMQRFEMRFSLGYNPSRWEEDTEDFYVLKTGKLPVVLTPRM